MTNNATGHQAEKDAADYLKSNGFKIVELNWKTKYCEIDIVAQKQGTIYFVEVKHRSSNRFGDGFDYITPKKLQQMNFAAELWIQNHPSAGNYQLAAVASSPAGFDYVEI